MRTNVFLRKLHIYFQGWWRAITDWKRVRLANELGNCCDCDEPIRPLGAYFRYKNPEGEVHVWHENCALYRLDQMLGFMGKGTDKNTMGLAS